MSVAAPQSFGTRFETFLFGALQVLIAVLIACTAYGMHFLSLLASGLIVTLVVIGVAVVPLLADFGAWIHRHAVLFALLIGIILGIVLPLAFSSGGSTGTDTSLRLPSVGFLLLLALPAVACAVFAGKVRPGPSALKTSWLFTSARSAYWIGSGFSGLVAIVVARQALSAGASNSGAWVSLVPIGLVLAGAVFALHTSDVALARWDNLSRDVQGEARAFLFQTAVTVLLLVVTLCVSIVLTTPDDSVREVLVTLLYAGSLLLIPQATWLRVRMHR